MQTVVIEIATEKIKSMKKFCSTDKTRQNFKDIVYNPKKKCLMATDGKVACRMLNIVFEVPNFEAEYSVTILTKSSILLTETMNKFPNLDRVFPDVSKNDVTYNFTIGKSKIDNQHVISIILNKLHCFMDYTYLLKLPKDEYNMFEIQSQTADKRTHKAITFKSVYYGVGALEAVMMPFYE